MTHFLSQKKSRTTKKKRRTRGGARRMAAAEEEEITKEVKKSKTEHSQATTSSNLMDFLEDDQQVVTFSVNGERIGDFVHLAYEQTFVMMSKHRKTCLQIYYSYKNKILTLGDYFYDAHLKGYECPDKPKKNRRKHENILIHLLNLLAQAFGARTIELYDASSTDIKNCKNIPKDVFLVAGKKGFYDNIAGFKNGNLQRAAKAVGEMTESDGRKLKDIARQILEDCDNGISVNVDDIYLIKTRLSTMRRNSGHSMDDSYQRETPQVRVEYTVSQPNARDNLHIDIIV
jgi:hypothetical protein